MLNNREYINKQQTEIEQLQDANENLLKDLKELSLEKKELEKKVKEKDMKISELHKKIAIIECKLNKYMNHVKMNEGREL